MITRPGPKISQGTVMKDERSSGGGQPKVGVVVGSGGIKAIGALGLFQFLEEADIDVDLLIGCSGGSIVSAYWANGQTAAYMREHASDLWTRDLFAKTDYRTLLSIAGLPFGRFTIQNGLLKSGPIQARLKQLFGEQKLEDLPTRMLIQTTDVLSGDPVLLAEGPLWKAVYASGAIFPMMPPISIDGRWLMDGAYSSPLPIMEAIQEQMDVIIAMSFEELTTEESKGFMPYFMRTIDYFQRWLRRNQNALSVDLHHHEIVFVNVEFDRYIGLRSTRRIPEIIQAGDRAVHEKKEEILAAIDSFSPRG